MAVETDTTRNSLTLDSYQQFLASKQIIHPDAGIDIPQNKLSRKLFQFQRDIVHWALRKGRAAIFADCGLGKTIMQVEWAKRIGGNVLILAPLAVNGQTVQEAQDKLHVSIFNARSECEESKIITNYEMMQHFNPSRYRGIVLDESSILKSFDGKFRNLIINQFRPVPYKLACTATPAPNDFMELGNHSEFLGNLSRTEMLSTFFVHDGGDTSKWRLKGHAEKEFWKWVASWSVMLRRPSDLGYSDEGFILPPLNIHEIVIDCDDKAIMEDDLTGQWTMFPGDAKTLGERRAARSQTVDERAARVAEIILCGKKNTLKQGEANINSAPKRDNGANPKQEARMTTSNTCETGTAKINHGSRNTTEAGPIKEESGQGIGTPTALSLENGHCGRRESTVPAAKENSLALNVSSELRENSTMQSSKDKAEGVPSAAKSSPIQPRENSPSITATEPAESVDCSVPTAIKESVNLETTQTCSSEQPNTSEQWLIWCNLNAESSLMAKLLPRSVEVKGSDSRDHKEQSMLGFAKGKINTLVSKSSICGFGMNFQSCHKVVFFGLSDSYESYYQAVRRVWRFGQKHPVDCYIVTSSLEGEVVKNIKRKEADANKMAEEMVKNMSELNRAEIKGNRRNGDEYKTAMATGVNWESYLGDSVEIEKAWEDESVGYYIYSPPFASLYTYSASERDMGNCRTHEEFYGHLRFLAPELYRTLKAGRLMSFHCMNLPTSKERDGVIGITDFRGELIRIFKEFGFIFHSEVCIWKNPVTAMQRTKAIGLLHKQVKKDSCMSRQGIPDYLVTMRKPGVNTERVEGKFEEYIGEEGTGPRSEPGTEGYSIEVWQRYASPVWMDIDASDTLQKSSARENEDERHICPLQLQVIERGIELWSNPGDVVADPYAGIGSTGYKAVKMGRRFKGCELKESYWKQNVANLKAAEVTQENLFTAADESPTLDDHGQASDTEAGSMMATTSARGGKHIA